MTDYDLIADIQRKVRIGEIDLRDMGLALQIGFDQDAPARILKLARLGAATMVIAEIATQGRPNAG